MTKKLKKVLITLTLLLLLPLYVDAADTLPNSDESGVITLNENVELTTSFTVEEGENITIDLAGYTITTTSQIYVYGTLIIKDSKGDGKITSTTDASVIEVTGTNAKITLQSGTIINSQSYGIGCYEGGTAEVTGGTINSLYSALSGNNTTGKVTFTIKGGTLTATYGPAIYMPSQGTLDIQGGVINGGISARMGTITISGGEINAITTYIDKLTDYFKENNCYGYAYNGNIWFDSALYVIGGTYTFDGGNDLVLTITGGTFNTTNSTGSAVTIYDLGKVKQSMTVNIQGGTFNTTNADEAYRIVKYSDIELTDEMKNSSYGIYEGNVSTTITGGTFKTDVNLDYVPSTYTVNNYGSYYKVEAQEITAAVEEINTNDTVTEITVGITSSNNLNNILSESIAANNDLDTDNINISVSIDMDTVDESDVDTNAVTTIATTVESINSNAVIAGYFDITLTVVNADDPDDELGTITTLTSPVTFTIVLPEDLQKIEDGYERTFYIIRYHDGKSETLEATLSEDGTYITFETDKFSTYAIAYYDTEEVSAVNTSDNIISYIILTIVSITGLLIAGLILKKELITSK